MKRELVRKIIAYAMCATIAFATVPVFAEETTNTWSSIDATYLEGENGNVVDISSYKANTGGKKIEIPLGVSSITIKGDAGKIYSDLSIVVQARTTNLTLIIEDLKISGASTGIDVTGNTAITTLKIKGENSITSTGGNGIAVYTGNTLTIEADNDASKLNIQAGSNSAGIGGRFYTGASEIKEGNGKINIKGGTINVVGGANAAGIGSATGALTTQEEITISGGVINATGGANAAGIGSGSEVASDATQISITGGTIVANGKGGGAGIGMGIKCSKVPFNISISGGNITAIGDGGGAGIGGGYESHAKNIIITGGTIEKAQGSGNSAGIGAGKDRGFDLIQIGSSNVKGDNPNIKSVIAGGSGASAIGTGKEGNLGGKETIRLYSGIISEATASGGAAAIGGGYGRGVNEVIIGQTRISKVYSEGGGAAIGGGSLGENGVGRVTLLPGSVIYADTNGESVLGGGTDRSLPVVVTGDIFSGKNNIDYVESQSADIKDYAFECYRVTGKDSDNNNIRTKLVEGDFLIKNTNDSNIDLKPTTNSNGRIYAKLQNIGSNLGSKGYYFIIHEAGKTYYATEFERGTETFKQKTKNADVDTELTVIKMEFTEVQFSQPTLSVASVSGSKVIPYAVSNIDFISKIVEDTSIAKEGADEFKWVKAIIDLKKLPTDIAPFDLSNSSKVKIAVSKRNGSDPDGNPIYTYDSTLTAAMNVSGVVACDDANKIITLNYPSSMQKYGEFKISILVPNTLTKEIDKYIGENVKSSTPSDQIKEYNAKISFRIITHIKLNGLTLDQPRESSSNIDLQARYWYLTKIN